MDLTLFSISHFTLAQDANEAITPLGAGGGATEGADGSAPAGAPGGAAQPNSSMMQFLPLMLIGLLAFMIISSVMSGRKQKKAREAMMSSLARQDRVQTIGGIIGTVAEIHDSEVILKVDDSSNTRIRFSRQAIQQILKKGRGGDIDHADESVSEPQLSQAV